MTVNTITFLETDPLCSVLLILNLVDAFRKWLSLNNNHAELSLLPKQIQQGAFTSLLRHLQMTVFHI